MPQYIIEREIPGIGELSSADLQDISQKSCAILTEMGPQIRWVESYLSQDKLYCIYSAPNEEAIHDHAEKGGFAVNYIAEIRGMISPETANA